ncbi:hypothetical protein EOD39_17695 [Acipenser ruthenus]|uniref:Uncharacterized protein n=1 Tax=Acipenser ruthenus TaxID=7906 RepID=A0A444V2L3_ACIRT|nr:hypothetical protein EOD39_17695 [Acipenser ruthenus]
MIVMTLRGDTTGPSFHLLSALGQVQNLLCSSWITATVPRSPEWLPVASCGFLWLPVASRGFPCFSAKVYRSSSLYRIIIDNASEKTPRLKVAIQFTD